MTAMLRFPKLGLRSLWGFTLGPYCYGGALAEHYMKQYISRIEAIPFKTPEVGWYFILHDLVAIRRPERLYSSRLHLFSSMVDKIYNIRLI